MFLTLDFNSGAATSGDRYWQDGRLASEQPVYQTAMNHTTGEVSGSSSYLSDDQEIILILLQIGSATLSLIGSSVIVFKILRHLHRNKASSPYDRIILGLSTCDIVSSCTYAVGPFLLPSETSQRLWATGNETTCSYLGFLTQLACFWAVWYNCILSFYYLLTVRFQVKREDFVRKYELWMHLSGTVFFPLTSITALVGNWYSEMRFLMTCWIGEAPKGCYESGNCFGLLIAYIFGGLPTVITVFSVIINNIIIYIFVRKNLLSSSPLTTRNCESETTDVENTERKSETDDPSQPLSIQHKLKREAAIQGLLYVSTFLLTFIPTFVIQILEGSIGLGKEDIGQLYPLLVLNSMLLPLQGFCNVFIYVRPSYIRFRDAHPEKPTRFILKQALFDPKIPRMTSLDASGGSLPAADKKNSKMKPNSGSNFSMDLDNIIEEDVSFFGVVEKK